MYLTTSIESAKSTMYSDSRCNAVMDRPIVGRIVLMGAVAIETGLDFLKNIALIIDLTTEIFHNVGSMLSATSYHQENLWLKKTIKSIKELGSAIVTRPLEMGFLPFQALYQCLFVLLDPLEMETFSTSDIIPDFFSPHYNSSNPPVYVN